MPLLAAASLALAAGSAAGLTLAAELARPGVGFLELPRYDAVLTGHDYAVYLGVWPLGVALALAGVALSRPWRILGAIGALLVAAGAIVVAIALARSPSFFAFGWTSYAPGSRPSSFHGVRLQVEIGLSLGLGGVVLAGVPLATRLRADDPLGSAAFASACVAPFPLAAFLAATAGRVWESSLHVVAYAAVLPFLGAIGASAGRLRLARLYHLSVAAFVPVAAGIWIERAVRAPLADGNWESWALAAPLAGALVAILVTLASVRPSLPFLFGTGALLALAVSGLVGAYLATSDPLTFRTDTQVVDAHLHLALAGFVLLALLGLAHARLPALGVWLGVLELMLLLAGTATLALGEWLAGHGGMPRRVSDYAPQFADENLAATVGGGLTAAAVVVFLLNGAQALRRHSRERERDRT